LNFILNFTNNYKNEKINKKIKIKITIKIKRVLNAIIMIINSNFREETEQHEMRIIIQDFKISTNGHPKDKIKSLLKNNAEWVIQGEY
jgi:hypothetical protein